MKQILLIAACLTAIITVQAQNFKIVTAPHYAEAYEEETGKLVSKEWVSAENFRQELPKDDGKTTIVIYRADSAKVYILDTEKKTRMSFSVSEASQGKLWGIESMEVEGRSQTKKLLGRETIEGYDCAHYSVTRETTTKNGQKESVTTDEWIYEPTQIVIRSSDLNRGSGYLIRRNIAIGAQPTHLFEIPRDYTAINIPTGGFMEMIISSSGKSEAQIKEEVNNSNAKSQLEQLKELGNDQNKTQEQKLQEMMKMLEGLNKKK